MAGIQTSNITTAASDDLVLDPASGKKVKLTSVQANPGETPVSVKADGTVEKSDLSLLTEMTDPEDLDWIVVQAGTARADDTAGSVVQGNLYKVNAENLGGTKLADPNPSDITWSPKTPPGSGTQSDPYRLTPALVSLPGESTTSVESMTINNQKADAVVLFEEVGETSGARFDMPNLICGADGTAGPINFSYVDSPRTETGTVYNGLQKIGATTVYVSWEVVQQAVSTEWSPTESPSASPTTVDYALDGKYGKITAEWADGDRELSANNLIFSVNGGSFNGDDKKVYNGDTIVVGFIDAVVAAAAEGQTITGRLDSLDGSYTNSFSMTKDVTPDAFTIVPLVDRAQSTVATSGNNPLKGVNAPSSISAPVGGANALTNVEVSVNGNAFTSSYPVAFNPGDSLQVRGTTGNSPETEYTATLTIGGTSAVFSVSTGAASDIVQPDILTPSNLDGNLQPVDVTSTSSAIATVDGTAVTQGKVDWQAYQSVIGTESEYLESDVITAAPGIDGGDTQVLTLASSTNLGAFIAGNTVTMNAECTLTTDTIQKAETDAAGVKLTFQSNQDLKYFEPGDIIQSANYQIMFDASSTAHYQENAFNGNISDGIYVWYPSKKNNEWYSFDLTRIYGANGIDASRFKMKDSGNAYYINSYNGNTYDHSGIGKNTAGGTAVGPSGLMMTSLYVGEKGRPSAPAAGGTGSSATSYAFYVDDELLVNGNDIKVVSCNPAENTMIVSGGAWTGPDGSVGPAGDQKTFVEVTKKGSGTLDSVNIGASQMTISNMKPLFIATDNASGEEFRVQDPSIPGIPFPPSNPIDPTKHTLHEELIGSTDSSKFNAWQPVSNYPTSSTLFVRTKQYDNAGTPNESEWSNWTGFQTVT